VPQEQQLDIQLANHMCTSLPYRSEVQDDIIY